MPLGNSLAHILAGINLLKLDLNLGVPFLRFCDAYLLFGKTSGQLQKVLTQTINPILTELNLSFNIKKSKSGKFHRDNMIFLGFNYYSGYIGIAEDKTEGFKQKIKKITHLTRKKSIPATIKLLNNQILGFAHYYKFANAKQVFDELDRFIRSRLRRYINRNKDSRSKLTNLILTNQVLKQLKLKSLTQIYEKYRQKIGYKSAKKKKIKAKTGQLAKRPISLNNLYPLHLRQKSTDVKIDELTRLVKKWGVKIDKIGRKLD